MAHTPHELAEDFPEHAHRISELRQLDAHFARLVESYHTVNGEVHRAESDVEPVSDAHMADIRKKRMSLKDAIYAALTR